MQHPEGLEGTFSGVWLDDFLESHGLDDAHRVRFIARDDYTTFLTPDQRAEKEYLLVTRLDGEPLSLDQLGPLMLVVPKLELPGRAQGHAMTASFGIATAEEEIDTFDQLYPLADTLLYLAKSRGRNRCEEYCQ
jgi:GGDEF domain-containing protein